MTVATINQTESKQDGSHLIVVSKLECQKLIMVFEAYVSTNKRDALAKRILADAIKMQCF